MATELARTKSRKKPVRKVFGRRVFEASGRKYRVELRADGLFGKRNHGRKWRKFLFLTLADAIEGQRQLDFEP